MYQMKTNVTYIIVLIVFFIPINLSAQNEVQDNKSELLNKSIEAYYNFAGANATVYNGKDQTRLPRNETGRYLLEKGKSRFDSYGFEIDGNQSILDTYALGELQYNGSKYPNTHLRLDLYKDELVILSPNKSHHIVLDPRKVEYALFNKYKTIYVGSEELKSKNLPKGYYQELYGNEKHSVLKKESFGYDKRNYNFTNHNYKYYLIKDGICYRIKNKNSFVNLFKSHKKALNHYAKSRKLDFRNKMEDALVELVKEYETLTEKE